MILIDLLFGHSLVYGLVLSIILGVLVYGSLYINPEIWLHDYPPDIQAKYGPASDRAITQRKILAALFFPVILGVLVASVVQLPRITGSELAFLPVFVSLFLILMIFNLFDLVILDWLIGIVIHPRFMILPGTEGMAGYRDYLFPLRGFLKGILILAFLSLVLAAIVIGIVSII